MPMEKVAFEFPDPDRDTSKDIKMKDDGDRKSTRLNSSH